ncbi:MAG: peptidyl-tRNA hydrolase Pth2 [Candidatus Anstonellales archaeon]
MMVNENMQGVNMKQAVIINKDLKMGKGKICAQVAHASLQAFLNASLNDREIWLNQGSKKIVLKATMQEMIDILRKSEQLGIANAIIRDAGLTQVKPGSLTAIALGPAEDEIIDALTSTLKLL